MQFVKFVRIFFSILLNVNLQAHTQVEFNQFMRQKLIGCYFSPHILKYGRKIVQLGMGVFFFETSFANSNASKKGRKRDSKGHSSTLYPSDITTRTLHYNFVTNF